ncbi:phosphotransferase family protein [Cryptosporangium sp. NPDC051539]|uniref:phosphotransferase family protein n=1 Tax=Cryptosporangium sp. NPDC051539 TaxID=3363962 RepID=UPI0037AFE06E
MTATGPGSRSRPRPTWAELPADVRNGIEAALGARVVSARSAPLGLTPGLASRVELDDGRRAFLKAAGAHRGAGAVEKLRHEARVLGVLPGGVPAPRLLGFYDDGRWAALACTDVDGRVPRLPWEHAELDRVLTALAECAAAATPSPLTEPRFVTDWAADLTGWRSLDPDGVAEALPAGLARWAIEHLDDLARLEAGWSVAADGDTLLHGDLRADNILLTADRVYLVDWPSSSVGAPWLDLLFFLPTVTGADLDEIVRHHPLTRDVAPATITATVAAIAGFLVTVGLEPPPWYAPEVRRFQLAEAVTAVRWLRTRCAGPEML